MHPRPPSAFLFPGISVGYIELADELRAHPECREYLDAADLAIRRSGADPATPAGLEIVEGVTIYALSCAIADLLMRRDIQPSLCVGYSLGLHSAMYCGGRYDFETGLTILLDLLNCVTRTFDNLGESHGMGAVIGLTEEELNSLVLSRLSMPPTMAVRNGERGFVLVGASRAIEDALAMAEQAGAMKTVRLHTRYGFHTPLLLDAITRTAIAWRRLRFREGRCPVMCTVSGRDIGRNDIIAAQVRNLTEPMNWADALRDVVGRYHLRSAYEVGPGDTLQRIARNVTRKLRFAPLPLGTTSSATDVSPRITELETVGA